MNKTQIVADYKATAGKSFAKAGAFDLQGWCQTYEVWEHSGMNAQDFAELLDAQGLNAKATVKTNLSHLKWALGVIADETGEDIDELSIMNIVTRWSSMRAMRDERYPSQNNKKKQETKPKGKFDAKTEARKYSVKELLAMLEAKAG